MQVMVFAPHPDDELIGCGGSLVKHRGMGRAVSVVYLTSGDAGSRSIDRPTLAALRESEATRAAAILNIDDVLFLRHQDGYLENTPAMLLQLINLIRNKRPDIMYLPHARDGHPDHAVTHHVVQKALGLAAGPWFSESDGEPWAVPTVLAYEVWTPLQDVSYLEDITEVAEQVNEALRCHESQVTDIDYEALVMGLAQYRGVMLGRGRLAEAFQVIRSRTSSMTAGGSG